MKSKRRVAALACIVLLGLTLSVPLIGAESGETTEPSLLEAFWDWVVDTLDGDDDDGTDPDEGSLQIPPGTP